VRILGSSFPGWTTPYMGFNMRPGYTRRDALVALERFAFRDLGALHLEVSDRGLTAADSDGLGFHVGGYDTYESDLTLDEATLFGKMDSAARRCVRKAEKTGVVIEHADDDAFADEYYAQLEDVFAKQGKIPTYPLERVRALVRHMRGTGNVLLVRARSPEGVCIATGIYPAHNRVAEFWGNASWRAHQHHRPNEALHWYAMKYWRERGVQVFDWGGGGRYKEKYGVTPVRVPWLRKSRFKALETIRDGARRAFEMRQRFIARRRFQAEVADTGADSGE
jgi:predicted N-acyltransferase